MVSTENKDLNEIIEVRPSLSADENNKNLKGGFDCSAHVQVITSSINQKSADDSSSDDRGKVLL